MDALPEQFCGAPASGYGMQCCQESTVQPFRLLPLQRVFGIGHRLPADLTSDDVYAPDPVYDLARSPVRFARPP